MNIRKVPVGVLLSSGLCPTLNTLASSWKAKSAMEEGDLFQQEKEREKYGHRAILLALPLVIAFTAPGVPIWIMVCLALIFLVSLMEWGSNSYSLSAFAHDVNELDMALINAGTPAGIVALPDDMEGIREIIDGTLRDQALAVVTAEHRFGKVRTEVDAARLPYRNLIAGAGKFHGSEELWTDDERRFEEAEERYVAHLLPPPELPVA